MRKGFAGPVEPLTITLAVLSSAAAGIHGTFTPMHVREHWLLGVSFALAATWLASRTVGLPFGRDAWTPEPVGFVDGLTTAYELAIVAICAVLLRPGGALRWLRSGTARGLVRTATIATAAFGIVALLIASAEGALDGIPGSVHRHAGSGAGGHALHLWLSVAAGIVVLAHVVLRPMDSKGKERS